MRTILMAVAMLALTACNTVAGIGKDLSALGDAMTGASEEATSGDRLAGGPDSRRN